MTTLEEAWGWYQSTKNGLNLMARFARKHWGYWSPDTPIARDDHFLDRDRVRLHDELRSAADHVEDFAVFVLFSVFEAEVRDRVLNDTAAERAAVTHTALGYWMRQAETAIEEGSFFRVLDGFKSPELNSLIEQVNQVRKYRNWVAHGRRDEPQQAVTPPVAYARLRAFLDALTSTPPAPAA